MPIAIPLQSAGLLSTLIFLIGSVYEVLSINALYRSQYFLIAILLVTLSIWAFLEIALISRHRRMDRLAALRGLLGIQVLLILFRHGADFGSGLTVSGDRGIDYTGPELSQAAVFLPLDLLLFLAISRCLIDLFATAERVRANQLQEQMEILTRTKAELEASETRYRNFFNLPLIGTAITAANHDWIAANQKTCAILGYSREELFARTWTELTHPDDLKMEMAQFNRMLRHEIKGYQLEKRFLRKDGTIVHALMAGGYGPSGPGQPDLFHMNIIDISDRKRVESELCAAQERQKSWEKKQRSVLEQKLKTSLTASAIVHEIQQPLATILLNCRLAEETLRCLPDLAIPEALRAQLNQLTIHGDQVTVTMERVRMLLRNVETQPTALDLANTIDSALIYLRRDLQKHQVTLASAGLGQPIPLLGDGAQLQSAVVNLIRNAIQAVACQPMGRRRLLVEVRRQGDQVEIQVADSGPGFPRHYSGATSWELLKSTKASGMGIGLFLAQTAAINHGGALRIDRSPELGGARVVIAIPRREPPSS